MDISLLDIHGFFYASVYLCRRLLIALSIDYFTMFLLDPIVINIVCKSKCAKRTMRSGTTEIKKGHVAILY